MGKKLQASTKTKRKCKTSKREILKKERSMILRKLQQVVESYNTNHDSNNLDCTSFDINNKTQETLLPIAEAGLQTNINSHNENIMSNNYLCYRCKHFLEIPQNLYQPVYKRTSSFIGQCEAELTFIQALIWLKSTTACVSQISVERLKLIFNKQWNISHRYNTQQTKMLLNNQEKNKCWEYYKQDRYTESKKHHYFENEYSDNFNVAKLKHPVNTSISYKKSNTKDAPSSPNFLDISDSLFNITPQIINYISHASSENKQNTNLESMPTNHKNESLAVKCVSQERSTIYITKNKKYEKERLLNPQIIPESDIDCSLTSDDVLRSPDMFDSATEQQDTNEHSKYEKDKSCLSTSKNYIGQMTENIVKSTIVPHIQNEATLSSSFSYYCKNYMFTQKKHAVARNEHECALLTKNQSNELNQEYNLDEEYFTPIINQFKSNHMSQDSSKSVILTQMENISQLSNEMIRWKQKYFCSSHKSPICSRTLNNGNSFEIQIADDNPNTSTNNESWKGDSAYYTSNIDMINHNETIKTIRDKQQHRYKLRSTTSKMVTNNEIINNVVNTASNTESSFIIQNNSQTCYKQDSFRKKYKSKQAQNLITEREKSKENLISAKWLNFTLESLDTEHVILESLKIILSTLGNEEIAREYMTRRLWKGTIQEEAVNAVLNISDIFRIEKKPNICRKEIVTIIINSFDEIATCVQLNKTSVWLYRIQIILELCNSLPICIQIINHLMEKLKLFRSIATNGADIQQNMYNTINQLHLIFYALGVTLRKYRTVVSNDRRCRSMENMIPHVSELWKRRYIDEELQDTTVNVDAMEERWSNILEDFSIAPTEYFIQFTEKSLSLVRILL